MRTDQRGTISLSLWIKVNSYIIQEAEKWRGKVRDSGQQQSVKTVGVPMRCVSGLTEKYGPLAMDETKLVHVGMAIFVFSATMGLFSKT
ncbi:hypothetical protein [Salinadaptatus halalkaliphilus]|uniref:hypothetical protein n=1 Tax=Salinadaptatus halalkaliphilus TaxID=2419781 RepID=UPI001580C79C|nr:hypothetical protein [Salinadaptatus halalkaliphilus]